MCLITKQKKSKTAKRDIPVWKMLEDGEYAKYFRFKYEVGVLNKTRLKRVNMYEHASLFTKKGWRAMNYEVGEIYTEKTGSWKGAGNPNRKNLTCIGQGFHAMTKKKMAKEYAMRTDKVVKFIIPKGSKYYTDVADCIVSNQIIRL